MTLRSRLTIAITGLLFVMVLALGFVAVRSAERVLVGQVDAGLVEVVDRFRFSGGVPDFGEGRIPLRQTYAVVVLDGDGDVIGSVPAGFEGEPEPLPDVSGIERPDDRRGTLATVPSVEGDPPYRAIAVAGPRGTTVVVAQPLDGVLFTVSRLRMATLLGGVVILGVGAAVTWWTVRRETRAVDGMVEAAKDVADGDLGRRIAEEPAAAELVTLRAALNDMFDRNESAFATERDTRDRLRQFVSDASHELRTPLTAISGYAQLHRMGGLEDATALNAAMARIEAETERMERLVADLLSLAKSDESRALELYPVALAGVIRDGVTDHEAAGGSHPVSVDVGDTTVLAEADALTQVVANLLANVRAHTPEGTTTRIEAARDGDRVTVSFADDGPGVDPTHLPHLFDRFYRAQDARLRSGPGSGLGLAIVAGLVEGMGGSVGAGRSPSGGLTVEVRLRAAENGSDSHGDT